MFATQKYLSHLLNTYFITNKMMVVKVTNNCNIKCEHCRENSGPGQDSILDWNVFKKTMDKIANNGWIAPLQGGEPTLYMDTVEKMIDYQKSVGIKTVLYTNGWWAYDENIKNRILKINPDILVISINQWTQKFIPVDRPKKILKDFEKELPIVILSEVHDENGPVIFKQLEFENVAHTPYTVSPVGRAKNLVYKNVDFYKKEWNTCFQCGYTLELDHKIYSNCCAGTQGCCYGHYSDWDHNNSGSRFNIGEKCIKFEEFVQCLEQKKI